MVIGYGGAVKRVTQGLGEEIDACYWKTYDEAMDLSRRTDGKETEIEKIHMG
ncbi:hypothetical protein MKW92_008937, partial [Papaver armeniacum]